MSAAYQVGSWQAVYGVIGAAAATLLGLMFMAVSMHLPLFANDAFLRRRVENMLIGLAGVLLVAVVVLLPQSPTVLGVELVAGALLHAGALAFNIVRSDDNRRKGSYWVRAVIGFGADTAFIVGALGLLWQFGPGMYVLLVATLVGLGLALTTAWSFLVDIHSQG